jgi:hypothetical protein
MSDLRTALEELVAADDAQDLERLIEAWVSARAALAQPEGWQPIETAPKDGTRIIVAKQSGYVMAWASSAYWFERQYKDREKYSGWTDGFDTLATPTHWMPLPAPPGEKP